MRWITSTISGLVLASVVAIAPTPASARRVYGAQIPDPADPIGDTNGHFVIRRSWDKAMQEIRRTYGRSAGIVIRRVDSPPSVKAYYVENTRAGRTWDGINIYEVIGKDAVYMTVLPARRP